MEDGVVIPFRRLLERTRAHAAMRDAISTYDDELARLSQMDTDSVKRLWDAYDGSNAPLGISGEAIHMDLNRRGEGRYCAV